jgi:hypothetical protein
MAAAHGFSVGLFDCCAPPGGCCRCAYVGCCASGACAHADVVARLPPSSGACCAGRRRGAYAAYCCADALFAGAVTFSCGATQLASLALASGVGFAAAGAAAAAALSCAPARACLHCDARRGVRRAVGAADVYGCEDALVAWACPACAHCQELNALDRHAAKAAAGAQKKTPGRGALAPAASFEAAFATAVAPLAAALSIDSAVAAVDAAVAAAAGVPRTAPPAAQRMAAAVRGGGGAEARLGAARSVETTERSGQRSPAPPQRARALSPAPSGRSERSSGRVASPKAPGRRNAAASPARKRGGA